ncbi:MAG TPA: HipA N-terminal domain-containing protein [Waddliaceae bacterium]
MKRAKVFVDDFFAGILEEIEKGKSYRFTYNTDYAGHPVSLTMPLKQRIYNFNRFPPFFEGVLPEGFQLQALLKKRKIDRDDYFQQLITVGQDLVGNVTVQEYL